MLHYNRKMLQNNSPNSPKKYSCESCHYICSKKSDFKKHISSLKHQCNNSVDECNAKVAATELLCASCKKTYKSRVGLWRHKKICTGIVIENNPENSSIDSSIDEMKILTNLVVEILKTNTELQKQNQDFQKQVLDVCKNNNTNNSNNTIINSNNKTFNLQVFLNEECKDAMNLKDFVKSFKLQLSDLELVGDEGFINGMTKVILAKLDGMDANTRPFHCTDLKRETVYVKEDDVWVREGPDNAKLTAAIKAIGHQNFFILKEYKALHPDCESTYSEFNDHYMNLIMKSAGCQKEDIAKVIKKLVKEIVIVK